MATISFITANYVARARNYDGKEDWGYHDSFTRDTMALTNWTDIVDDVKDAGFPAADLWAAHCHFGAHTAAYRDAVKQTADENNLRLTSYAGGLVAETAKDIVPVLAWIKSLDINIFAGGLWGKLTQTDFAPEVNDLFVEYGLRWAYENHPEKTADEILLKIGRGKHRAIGVALDTGWCGTQGMDALDALQRLREHLFILHLKDVKAPGKHDTCALGDGCVGIEKIVRYLKDTHYDGVICIEHEPYDRDPMPEVKESMKRLKEWLA